MRYTHFRGPDDVITYVTSLPDNRPLQPPFISSTLSHLIPPYTFVYLNPKYSLFRGPDDVINYVTSPPDNPPLQPHSISTNLSHLDPPYTFMYLYPKYSCIEVVMTSSPT